MSEPTYNVPLTVLQIRLLRELVCKKAMDARFRPLPEDGDLYQRLCELDKPLYRAAQVFDHDPPCLETMP